MSLKIVKITKHIIRSKRNTMSFNYEFFSNWKHIACFFLALKRSKYNVLCCNLVKIKKKTKTTTERCVLQHMRVILIIRIMAYFVKIEKQSS